jgi:hypothetical protein
VATPAEVAGFRTINDLRWQTYLNVAVENKSALGAVANHFALLVKGWQL